jgi:hypothetical protein
MGGAKGFRGRLGIFCERSLADGIEVVWGNVKVLSSILDWIDRNSSSSHRVLVKTKASNHILPPF